MKNTFLLAAIFGFLSSNAQQNPDWLLKKPTKKIPSYQSWNKKSPNDFRQYLNDKFKTSSGAMLLTKRKLLYTLKDSTKVFSLPQDNMICIVPDMKQFNMPNAAPSSLFFELQNMPGKIPNAASPLIIQRKDKPAQ